MLRCDFCGKEVKVVKRIAIDKGYDRLSIKHQIKYACEECSTRKERERRDSLPEPEPPVIDKSC